jgi:hypothetical protein
MKFILLLILLLFTGCSSIERRRHLYCVDRFLHKGMDGETARKTCLDIYQNPYY